MIDPVIHWALKMGLALLFFMTAIAKLRDMEGFGDVLKDYAVVPDRFVYWAAAFVIVAEAAIAVSLVIPGSGALPLIGLGGLLVIYSAAIGTNVAKGRTDIYCGCAGPAGRQPLSTALIFRNSVVILFAAAATLQAAAREWVWVDTMMVTFGVMVLVLLYAVVDAIIANAARSAAAQGGA